MTVNTRRFPFDFHQTLSGAYKTFLRGEPLDSSDGQDEGEDETSDVEFVDEIVQKPPGEAHVSNLPAPGKKLSSDAPEVKKLPRFRVMDHKLVRRDLNPRLPKFRVLETHDIPPAESKRKHRVPRTPVCHVMALSVFTTAAGLRHLYVLQAIHDNSAAHKLFYGSDGEV